MNNTIEQYTYEILYIEYNDELSGSRFLLDGNGTLISIKELSDEELRTIKLWPNIQQKLINGCILYICNHDAYIGKSLSEGPYGENKIFVSEFDSTNPYYDVLLKLLDEKIKKGKSRNKVLTKLGYRYI